MTHLKQESVAVVTALVTGGEDTIYIHTNKEPFILQLNTNVCALIGQKLH